MRELNKIKNYIKFASAKTSNKSLGGNVIITFCVDSTMTPCVSIGRLIEFCGKVNEYTPCHR